MGNSFFNRFDSIVILDTETTGVRCKADEIIELAALRARPDGRQLIVEDEIDVFIRMSPGKRLPAEITRITGITEEMIASEGIEKKEACVLFSDMLKGESTLIIAYNAQFDLCFLYYFLSRMGMADALKGKKMLDAMTVYKDRREYPHRLSDAVAEYSLETQNTHRAIDDARATMELILAMEKEESDLESYINLFGYNPKYGPSGPKISSVTYAPQNYYEKRKLYETIDKKSR